MPVQLIIPLAQLLFQYGPDVAQHFYNAFHHPDTVKPEEWDKMFDTCRDAAKKLLADLEKK